MKAITLIAGMLMALPAVAGPEAGKEFVTMDSDRDGKVSAAEHATGARTMFVKMDADRDGKVTAAEMSAAHQAITGQAAMHAELSASEKIKVVDSDGDGILTADEHAKGSAAMFTKMDRDRDGWLTKQEMAAGHAAMLKR
jgi:Ca2+-binding EF-hand superfamily protein